MQFFVDIPDYFTHTCTHKRKTNPLCRITFAQDQNHYPYRNNELSTGEKIERERIHFSTEWVLAEMKLTVMERR